MRRRGITLVEVLLAASISALIIAAAGSSYVNALRAAQGLSNGREAAARRFAFESEMRDVFAHAYLDPDTTNLNTYFVSGDAVTAPAGSGSTGNATSGGGGSGLVLTVLGRRLPDALLASTEDFETNNGNYGPVAGVTEIGLSTTPVGSPSGGVTGLFLRSQAPADADPTQGGTERLLLADAETVSFEFYDGAEWVATWDTTTQTTRRLPSAVRITYRLTDDTTDRVLTVAVPTSDVTPDDPVAQEAAS